MITLIIWGTKGVEGVKESGQFFCPSCNANVPYDHKRIRRFFTLYFIPLIPLGTLQEWIECKQCGGSFETEVLQMQPQLPAAAIPQPGGYPQPCLLYTSPSPRDGLLSRMPSSA